MITKTALNMLGMPYNRMVAAAVKKDKQFRKFFINKMVGRTGSPEDIEKLELAVQQEFFHGKKPGFNKLKPKTKSKSKPKAKSNPIPKPMGNTGTGTNTGSNTGTGTNTGSNTGTGSKYKKFALGTGLGLGLIGTGGLASYYDHKKRQG
jgi:hypothetical protein